MSRVWTILLVVLAATAAVFLFVIEPKLKSTRERQATENFVFWFDPERIRGLRIVNGDQEFRIDRRNDGWWIGPWPKDRASFKAVSDIVATAGRLEVHDIIRAKEGIDLDDFDLEKPKLRLDLVGDGEDSLYFGKEAAGQGRIYVRKANSRDVLVVDDDLQKLVFRKPEEFRDRRLTNLTPERIDGFTIKRGTGEIEVKRVGRDWELVRPLHARADSVAVNSLLEKLLGLQIVKFVADEAHDLSAYGLGEPQGEVVFQVDGEVRPSALRIGTEVIEQDRKLILAQFTARDSVYHLPMDAWTLLQIDPDDLRDRRLLALNLDAIDAIRFQRGEQEWMLEREGDDWKTGERRVAAETVNAFVDGMSNARVVEYLPLSDETLERSGLGNPVAGVTFDAWLSENTPEAVAGRRPVTKVTFGKVENGNLYVRVDDDPEICVVPESAFDALPASAGALGGD